MRAFFCPDGGKTALEPCFQGLLVECIERWPRPPRRNDAGDGGEPKEDEWRRRKPAKTAKNP
jgi:hypothetical protein